ncbi:stalk domain-containing protein [Thermoanaerobacterium sp. CMT5567-10]|uniref:stalk domain-containing protein n=1 Tax=Thermoanaerobacterium sp. CMT5567-10 TaxID=3061989 RepID=UPI0026E056B2|nr:stalk domain-containing protein [Thermoanaerobacterium sp. CMT5567-10]WKV10278.1 stalk domain-containing protein [Thermoanaerobacterium sp. CMT5567-10]
MLKGRKLVAVLLTFVMVMASMVTGFAFTYVGGANTSTSSSNTGLNKGTTTPSWDYQVKFVNDTVTPGSTTTLEIKVVDNQGNIVKDATFLKSLADTMTLTSDENTLVFSNVGGTQALTQVTTSNAVYNAVYTTDTYKIGLDPNSTGSLAVVSTSGWSTTVPSFYVAKYGKVQLIGATLINGKKVDYSLAQLYFNGLTPSVSFASGDSAPLESYPETATITASNADYTQPANAELFENGNLIATFTLTPNSNATGYNSEVLPPMSASNKYTLRVYGPARYYNYYTGQTATYFASGSIELKPQAAKSTLVKPTDNALAAGINDTVTFTLDDKLPNGNTQSVNSNLKVDLAKYVRFTVLKSDNSTSDTVNKDTNNNGYIDTDHNIQTGVWYAVTDDGLKLAGSSNGAISGTYDKTTGKITVTVNIPKDDYLKVEAAYTDYVGNKYEDKFDFNGDGVIGADDKTLKDLGYEKTFVVADLQAKLGTITADKTALNADDYQNVTFSVYDVHKNPISDTTLTFNSPVVFLGGTGSTASNVTNTVKTDSNGKVTATLYSAFPASITVSDSGVTNDLTLTVGNATPATVVFTPGSTTYTVNGVDKTADAAPYITSTGRTVVPARFLADALGAESYFAYSADGHSVVTFVKGTTVVKFVLGTNQVTITKNGVTVTDTMDVQATVNDQNGKPVGRTYIPARYLAEALGYTVNYDATTGTVTVTNAQ